MIEMVQDTQKVIGQKILFIWNNAQEASKNVNVTIRQPFKYLSNEKGEFFLNKEGIKCFTSILEVLKKDEDIRRKFSDRYLEETLRDLVIDLLAVVPQRIVTAVRVGVTQLFSILSQPDFNWLVIMPIINLKINGLRLCNIGCVTFTDFSKNRENTILRNMKKRAKNLMRKKVFPKFRNRVVAIAHVSAVDEIRAQELGEKTIREAIDVLRFYRLNPHLRNISLKRNNIDVAGRIQSDEKITLCLRKPTKIKQVHPFFERTGFLFPLEINSAIMKSIRQHGFNVFREILRRDEKDRTEFEKRLLSAVNFCALSTIDGESTNSFVNSMISLEAVLLKDREQKSGNLSERVALLAGKDRDEKKWLFNEMIRLYRTRSEIVHAGYADPTESDLRLLQLINYTCIIRLIRLYRRRKFVMISDLIKWCQDKKFR